MEKEDDINMMGIAATLVVLNRVTDIMAPWIKDEADRKKAVDEATRDVSVLLMTLGFDVSNLPEGFMEAQADISKEMYVNLDHCLEIFKRVKYCAKCLTTLGSLDRCSGCNNASYCSAECQRADRNDHELTCKMDPTV